MNIFNLLLFFKTDLQGRCDSLVYSEADSTIRLFSNPVLWSEQNQITGDSISIRSWSGHIDKLKVRNNSFIISEADSGKYNQIAGRNMTGSFSENELSAVEVEGNGQLIYFPTDEKSGKPRAIGYNKGECSNLHIEVSENKITRIRMETETNSVFNPLKLSKPEDFLLKNFVWRISERPKSKEDLLK